MFEDGSGWGAVLRVFIEINLTKPLPRKRSINLKGNIVLIPLTYEKLPRLCIKCGRLIHGSQGCEKGGIKMEEVDQFSSWLRAESYQKSQGRGGSDSGQQQGTPEYFRPTESQHITKAVTPTISPESFSMKVTGKSVDVYVGETPGTKRLNIEENRDPACKQEADINSHAQVGLNKGSRSQGPSAVLITTLVEVPTNRPMCMGPQMDNQLSVQNPMNLEAEVEPEELKGGSTS